MCIHAYTYNDGSVYMCQEVGKEVEEGGEKERRGKKECHAACSTLKTM